MYRIERSGRDKFIVTKNVTSLILISEKKIPRISSNIFGEPLLVYDYDRVYWCKYFPASALSSQLNSFEEAKDFIKKLKDNQ
jgi:hypothetical protein